MKISLSLKIQFLVSATIAVVCLSVCLASYRLFSTSLSRYAHEEVSNASKAVEGYIEDRTEFSTAVTDELASRPDLADAIAKGNDARTAAIAKDTMKSFGVDFVTIADSSGTVIARGHSEKRGDSLTGQKNVARALEGKTSHGIEEGTVIKFSIRAGAPVVRDGKVIGTVSAGYDLATNGFVDGVKDRFGVECTIFQGDTRASTTIESGGKRAVGTKLDNAKIIDTVIGKSETYLGKNVILGKPYDTAYWPIRDIDGKTVGMFFIGKDLGVMTKAIEHVLIASVLLALGIGIVTLFASGLFVRGIVQPIRRATAMLKDISDGSGDLTRKLEVTSKDEIGNMATYFNSTIGTVRDIVAEIGRQTQALSDIGSELTSNMNETAAAANEISANIQSVKNQTVNQSASVTQTSASMSQIRQNIERLDGFIANQAEGVAQSSSAIEEMLANIASVSRTLAANGKNIEELTVAAGQGRQDLSDVTDVIRQIAHDSEGLIEISGIIESIASQTNLLSMNAEIEAAHAGSAGKGFAVVADEIRKLAESSSSQAQMISSALESIKDSVDRVAKGSEVVQRQFADIEEKITTLAEQEDAIRRAMEEQGAGSNEILEAIGRVNETTTKVKASSGEMLVNSDEVIRESGNLGHITEEVSGSMTEMATGIGQITAAINDTNNLSQKNRESIEALAAVVRKFKI